MTVYFSKGWTKNIWATQSPPDIAARLVAPFCTDIGSLVVAHCAGLVLCAAALIQIGGLWAGILTAANFLVTALRVHIVLNVPRLSLPKASDLLRWRTPYQAVGLAWSLVNAALCGLCLAAGDEDMRIVAILFVVTTTAGIASRSAGAPRFALAEIALWILPLGTLVMLLGHGGWIALPIMAGYGLALYSSVWRHHMEFVVMIDAEQASSSARSALAEREAELRCVFDNAAAGFAEVDLTTGRIIRVNRVFCEMTGRSKAELLAISDLSELNHPDDRQTRAQQWDELRKTSRSFECERRYIRSDGTVMWGRIGVSAVLSDADGRALRVLSVVQDITDRKVAEAELQGSQNLLGLSLDIGDVGTFRRDYVAGLIYCGPQTRFMIGMPPGDAPVVDTEWLATIVPEDLPRFLKDVADARTAHRSIVSFDYRFVHPQKGIRYAETRSRLEYDATGNALSSVGVVIDVTDRRRAEIRLAHMAEHDPLTDLPNRSLFRLRLDEAIAQARHGQPCAVHCIDLDHFKDVNDTFGHPVGDALLCAVTTRLEKACRPTDTVARLGGDEFAIIQSPIRHRGDAEIFAQRLIAILAAPYEIEGIRIAIGSSIGISCSPDDGIDPDRLLRNADMALYGAKGAGRGRHQLFESAMDEKLQARRALDMDLRQAIAEEALEVFYQPLVGIATRQICGFEALIRWPHPTRGLVMPDQFIPLAESNGLIVPIGAFVLHRACMQAALWPSGASVAVNLSALEFSSPDIVETVASALRHSTLDPHRLELEITETTMLQNTEATLETLTRLKALGVRISIDDFGTGFSSLSYLQRFPFDKVKIDRFFIAPLGTTRESLAIVEAVVKLCEGLDMETTAEGVETEQQLAILAHIGCTEAQGYYFSRPCPAGDIAELIGRIDRAAGLYPANAVAA